MVSTILQTFAHNQRPNDQSLLKGKAKVLDKEVIPLITSVIRLD